MFTYLLVLISAAWLLYYSIESPYFQIREITVSGTSLLEASQIQDTAGVQGSNALLVQRQAIEQSISNLAAVQFVTADLTVDGRVAVEVTERVPLVQWQAREGSFLVDKEGVVFGRQAPPAPLIVIRDIDGAAMDVGSRVDPAVLSSVQFLEASLPTRAGIKPSSYDFSRSNGLSVVVPDGPRIVFGDAEDLDAKFAALAAVREHLDSIKSRAESIDLRFRGRPTYVLAPVAPVKQGQTR